MIEIFVNQNGGGKEYYSIPDGSPSHSKTLRELAQVAHDMTIQPQGVVVCEVCNEGEQTFTATFDFAPH